KVSFTPQNELPEEAIFKVHNDFLANPLEVNLSGSGKEVQKIRVSSKLLEFKDVIINQDETKNIEIENIGTAILQISGLNFNGTNPSLFTVSAGGTTPIDIQTGAKHTIEIMFSPVTVGNFSATLEIEHNAVNEASPMELSLLGEAIDIDPQITMNFTTPWDFGTVSTILPIRKMLEIESTGVDPLKVRSIKFSSGIAFSIIVITDSVGDLRNPPQLMNPGKKLFVEIEFAPQNNIQYDDKLIVDHNGTNTVRPFVFDMTGIGRPFITRTYQFTGSPRQFTIPVGVVAIKTELWGASGGSTHPNYHSTIPGKGGYVSGVFYVTPGETLEIYVGGKGEDGVFGAGGLGGWNGGGFGGTYAGPQQFGGGGGGATDIRRGGNTLYDRIIVAGAGGGAAAHMSLCHGGAGGGLIGGGGCLDGRFQNYYCGKGGTQTYGGGAGILWGVAERGGLGKGGDVTCYPIHTVHYCCGGGGGSGYWGGGGGTTGGGGGGSSYTDPQSVSNVQHQQGINIGNGKIKLTY
ncbi:MAG: choice-of-anchor D domain-containing protein, partial [Planctomycetes bacterium]|nr:choice-of-anchor D domain-containing protein [Planctomycetota bacterium]